MNSLRSLFVPHMQGRGPAPAGPLRRIEPPISAYSAVNSPAQYGCLIRRSLLTKDAAGGRSTSYSLVVPEGSDH